MKKFQVGTGVVLTKQLEKKEEGISFLPFWKWLLEQPAESPGAPPKPL